MKSPCAFMAFCFRPYKNIKQIYYDMRKQITLLCMMAFLSSLHVTAQSFRKYIDAKPELSASNGVAYPTPSGKLTPPPAGYVPVYISHYGRHGSRWGELTPLGAEQHKQIARRMFKRFPSVFRDSVWVDAKSTVVIRCILSMENALQELLRQNPHLRIRHDASEHDMYYMNFSDKKLAQQKESEEVKETMKDWEKRNMNYQPLMSRLFKNADYVDKNVNAEQLTTDLFSLAGFVQNSEIRHSLSLYDIFTPDERYRLWQRTNVWWYLHFAGAPQSGAKQPFSQRNLLRNIITEADSCLALPHPGATLRFGHETMVMPLACLLDLNGSYVQVFQVDSLEAKGWIGSRIFPMAANIQLVFYKNPKNPKADVLVKALLNEEEATLPLPPTSKPYYYKWSDFRRFFLNLINNYHD